MSFPVSDEMRRRWSTWRYTAQAEPDTDSDYRPNGKVFVARGLLRHHHFPEPSLETNPDLRRAGNSRWRGDWDEKYGWLGQPGEHDKFDVDSDGRKVFGSVRLNEYLGMVELPYIKTISCGNSTDQNGVGQATVVIQNASWQSHTENDEMVYHELVRGFFSPFMDGHDLYDSTTEAYGSGGVATDESGARNDPFTSGNATPVYNSDGKRISGLVLPNRHIDIFQGYGDELQRTFTGLIDDVTINSADGSMTIVCSDFGRVSTEITFMKQVAPPTSFPGGVAFGDAGYWSSIIGGRRAWPKKGAPSNTILVSDITDIVGHILAWCGFQTFAAPRPGRIGGMGIEPGQVEEAEHNAVFDGENFDKGVYLVDGLNKIKQLLGFLFYTTPEFDPDRPMSARFRDPTVYDAEYSRYSIGMPHFEPPNIWQLVQEDKVEQFRDDQVLINASLTYSNEDIRKLMYVVNSGVVHTAGSKKGEPLTMGYSAPWQLEAGIAKTIYYDVKSEMGANATFSRKEVAIFILMTMIQTIVGFCKGSFTCPGYPGAKMNDQIDILESQSGTWRRFYVTGWQSEMSLGPNAKYQTTYTVCNIDNIFIRRLKKQIYAQGGFGANLGFQGSPRETASPA